MNEINILEEMQEIINDIYYSNAIIGCLSATNEEEILYQDLKATMYTLNLKFKEVDKRLNDLYKSIAELTHEESE